MLTRCKQLALPLIALTLVAVSVSLAPAKTTSRQKGSREFKLVEHSCESGCADEYESADGKHVSLVFACHTADAVDARRETQRMLAEGTVIRRSKRIGQDKLSERAVMLKPAEAGKRSAMIFWYHKGDSCFSYIEAESLNLALAFEQSKAADEPLQSYRHRSK